MSMPKPNLLGRVFGRLTVVGEIIGLRVTKWYCRCACGARVQVRSAHLMSGSTKSCGCLALEGRSSSIGRAAGS